MTRPLGTAEDRDGNTAMFSPCRRAGDLVFVSGQASVDGGRIVPGTFEEEMRRSIENVRRILAGEGLELSHVVRVGAYVRDAGDLPEYNRIYLEYFGEPLPARTTITNCLGDRIKFELDVVAYGRA
ncbi:RidA family protein [Qaidamihabitans albus]|uniref:RidA family protein n=1 Tax=Qaidamihabitans albus TaxID=2795733 RepID=UPI0018F22EBB|nr:RidA family protein [Qaidamihabitans albus]